MDRGVWRGLQSTGRKESDVTKHTQVKISHKKQQIPCDVTYMWNLQYDATELSYRTEADSDTGSRTVVAKGEGAGGGWSRGLGEASCCVRSR